MEKSPSIKVHRVTNPPLFIYTFNFSQTVGEMVFVSFEIEKMRMFFSSVNSSLGLGLSAVVGCSSLLSHVKPLAKGSVPISAGQFAEL